MRTSSLRSFGGVYPEPFGYAQDKLRRRVQGRPRTLFSIIAVCCGLACGCATLPARAVGLIQEAKEHYRAGQYDDAQRSVNLVIFEYPQTKGVGEAYYVRAMCFYRAGLKGLARADLEQALKTTGHPGVQARIYAQLGHLAYGQDQFGQAAGYYAAAVADYPNELPKDELYYRFGDSLQKVGRWRKSRQVLPKVWYLFEGSTFEDAARRKFRWPHDYFAVQCGAFEDSRRARELTQHLQARAFDAEVQLAFTDQQPLNVVYVGRYSHHDDAHKTLLRVQEEIPDAFIVP